MLFSFVKVYRGYNGNTSNETLIFPLKVLKVKKEANFVLLCQSENMSG